MTIQTHRSLIADSHPPSLSVGTVLTSPSGHRYGIVAVRQLSRSVYYDALDLTCPACRRVQPGLPPDGLCVHCQRPLTPRLIHAQPVRAPLPGPDDLARLVALSAGHPAILHHQEIFENRNTVYAAVVHPGRWGVLVRGRRTYTPEAAVAVVLQIGHVLQYFHSRGFAYSEVGTAGMESLIFVGVGEIRLATLSPCVPLSTLQTARPQVERNVLFLCNLLTFLLTGRELLRSEKESLPVPIRSLLERVQDRRYTSVEAFLNDLATIASVAPRPLTPIHGQATHPGRQRSRNEDAVAIFTFTIEQKGWSAPLSFYLVADGMGGHDAGDLASRTVSHVVADRLIQSQIIPALQRTAYLGAGAETPASVLEEAIQEANEALLQHARSTGSDLGSTVTAALVIGDRAVIANVGDSRTYLLRDGRLEQITQDHSLVARLADAGVIRKEQIRTHPRRNEIYRSLGHHARAEVDIFSLFLRPGDRLILCSDGLWEMVPDKKIGEIVRRARSPQQACDELVAAANRAGGEDNIAVVVVEMV